MGQMLERGAAPAGREAAPAGREVNCIACMEGTEMSSLAVGIDAGNRKAQRAAVRLEWDPDAERRKDTGKVWGRRG